MRQRYDSIHAPPPSLSVGDWDWLELYDGYSLPHSLAPSLPHSLTPSLPAAARSPSRRSAGRLLPHQASRQHPRIRARPAVLKSSAFGTLDPAPRALHIVRQADHFRDDHSDPQGTSNTASWPSIFGPFRPRWTRQVGAGKHCHQPSRARSTLTPASRNGFGLVRICTAPRPELASSMSLLTHILSRS